MMAAVISLISGYKVEIEDAGSVSKSYPTFFDELKKAGLADSVII